MSTTFSEYENVSLPSHDAELHDMYNVVLVALPQEDEGDSVCFPFLCSRFGSSFFTKFIGLFRRERRI